MGKSEKGHETFGIRRNTIVRIIILGLMLVPLIMIIMRFFFELLAIFQGSSINLNTNLTFCEYSERFCDPSFILADSPLYSTLAVFFVIWLIGTMSAFYIVIRSYFSRRAELKQDLKELDEVIANSDAIDAELEMLQKALEKQQEKLLKIQRVARLPVNAKVQPDA